VAGDTGPDLKIEKTRTRRKKKRRAKKIVSAKREDYQLLKTSI